jgi:hypothetical protein
VLFPAQGRTHLPAPGAPQSLSAHWPLLAPPCLALPLPETIIKSGVASQLAAIDKRIVAAFVHGLALIWFDFDTLPSARKRPIKTWRRAKSLITSTTADLLTASRTFLTSSAAAGAGAGSGDAALTSFTAILKGLGVAQ